MEPECSLLCSQEPATGLCPKPHFVLRLATLNEPNFHERMGGFGKLEWSDIYK